MMRADHGVARKQRRCVYCGWPSDHDTCAQHADLAEAELRDDKTRQQAAVEVLSWIEQLARMPRRVSA